MESSNEVTLIDSWKIHKLEESLYDVKEFIDDEHETDKSVVNNDDSPPWNLIADSGDIINYSNKNLQDDRLTERPLTHVDSQHAILMEQELLVMTKHDEYSQSTEVQITDDNIILSEPSSRNKSQDEIPSNNTFCLFNIEYYPTSTYFVCPQFGENQIQSFQQLWSSQVYSTKLNTSESTLSILCSLIILLSKLIITGFNVIYSCTTILRYDTLLFGFSYWLGILFGTNAYFYIDFLLIGICIISILVATYEKWLFHSVDLNEYENIDSERQYWIRVKLAAYGLAVGTITTYII